MADIEDLFRRQRLVPACDAVVEEPHSRLPWRDRAKTSLNVREYREANNRFYGNDDVALKIAHAYLPVAQVILGALTHQLRLGGIQYGARVVKVTDNVMIRVVHSGGQNIIEIAATEEESSFPSVLPGYGFVLFPADDEHPEGFRPNPMLLSAYFSSGEYYYTPKYQNGGNIIRSGNQFFFDNEDVYSWYGANNGDGPRLTTTGSVEIYKNGVLFFSGLGLGNWVAGFHTLIVDGVRYYYIATAAYDGNESTAEMYVSAFTFETIDGVKQAKLRYKKKLWPDDPGFPRRTSCLWPVRFDASGTRYAFLDVGGTEIASGNHPVGSQVFSAMFLLEGFITIDSATSPSVQMFGPVVKTTQRRLVYSPKMSNSMAGGKTTWHFSHELTQTISDTYTGSSSLPIALNFDGNVLKVVYETSLFTDSIQTLTGNYQQTAVSVGNQTTTDGSGTIVDGRTTVTKTAHHVYNPDKPPVGELIERVVSSAGTDAVQNKALSYVSAITNDKITYTKGYQTAEAAASSEYSITFSNGVLVESIKASEKTASISDSFHLESSIAGISAAHSISKSSTTAKADQLVKDPAFWTTSSYRRFIRVVNEEGPRWDIFYKNRLIRNLFGGFTNHYGILRGFGGSRWGDTNTVSGDFSLGNPGDDFSYTDNYQSPVDCGVLKLFGMVTQTNQQRAPTIHYVYDNRTKQWLYNIAFVESTRYAYPSGAPSGSSSYLFIYNHTASSFGFDQLLYQVNDKGEINYDTEGKPVVYNIPSVNQLVPYDVEQLLKIRFSINPAGLY